ncbi:bacillithiol biosynthesis cysteine-adding enzyme BshC [Pseudobacter ginsenosidimutans]|uniref:Putative cysteine ligase BshC n=2 Tax=Pseudobacter ginsenosidimutans TaxID=661488 RepID=A0A4V2F246_9BACT|nr:bacillithiol biosynthesis cysteine-adding enzyme BshC [Pseudobacter ginsenosidimutans]
MAKGFFKDRQVVLLCPLMNCSTTQLPYSNTGYFSKVVIDYLNGSPELRPFYEHLPNIEGIKAAIGQRQQFIQERKLLVEGLQEQYKSLSPAEKVQRNIQSLLLDNTFTITTAHQPAIFTGHLYFIYKIVHTIRLADQLKKELPEYNFVPVFWMGSEDADLDELGNIWLSGDKLVWNTRQTGAVGRMNTKGLDQMIHRISGELSVLPHGEELIKMIREAYLNSPDIQTATFKLIHELFAEYGLVTIIPDTALLKRLMVSVFEDDLYHQTPGTIVEKTIAKLGEHYKVQANPRAINLFYLKDGIRELIEWKNDHYEVRNTQLRFTKAELAVELNEHPDRFSPNVILRGLYQETLLPNIAFIGGGGETSYWLELKDLFHHYKVPYPVLVVRNSFLMVEKKWEEKIERMGLQISDFFQGEQQLLTSLVTRQANGHLKLAQELEATSQLYEAIRVKASQVDETLVAHIEALKARTVKPLQELEKKMLRAEKRKYEAEQQQIQQIRQALFPTGGLQERVENFMPYYAKWGRQFIDCIYKSSLSLEQEFVIIKES